MNETPESTQEVTTEKDDELTAIDALRTSIEQEHMFKTCLLGYNKREVIDYLDSLSEQFQQAVQDQSEELKRLAKENEQLYALIDEQKEKLANVRSEERRKLQAEYDMQEGMVDNLRERNSKLMADNQAQQLEIAALTEQLKNMHAVVSDRSEQLDTLSVKLNTLLAGKLKEFAEVIEVWKTEFCDVVSAERHQITEL